MDRNGNQKQISNSTVTGSADTFEAPGGANALRKLKKKYPEPWKAAGSVPRSKAPGAAAGRRSRKKGFYEACLKRPLDVLFSFTALLVLSPLLLVLTVTGAVAMKGNPFFVQPRPGKDEKIFLLVKFRTMSNAKGKDGKLLPDEARLNAYGKFLRSTSLDELPELWNIFKGEMSFVGPRPLLVEYLPRYNAHQTRRHEVRPGLTGYAQVHGRNAITWEKKFDLDIWYVDHISFAVDAGIFLQTAVSILKREGISSQTAATMEEFQGTGSQGE